MIAKAKAISHGGISIDYIARQGDTPVVKLNFLPSGVDPWALWERMRAHRVQSQVSHRQLKNDVIRIEISPTEEESAGWTMNDWRELAEQFVREFDSVRLPYDNGKSRPPCNMANSQYIVTLHYDSESGIPHMHLDCNRVDMDGYINDDQMIGKRAVAAANRVNRLRKWNLPTIVSMKNKAIVKQSCLAALSELTDFSWNEYSAKLESKGYKVKFRLDSSGAVKGYMVQMGNSVYKSSDVSRDLTPSRIRKTWEGMHPESRYEQMTPKERLAFVLSPEGEKFIFQFCVNLDGKSIEISVSGKAAQGFYDEIKKFPVSSQAEQDGIFKTAMLLFANYVVAATTFAENCGGGVSSPDSNWGRDKNEEDILWARRCCRMAREMVTTPRRRGMRM